MKILFKDKKDMSKRFISAFNDHFLVGGRDSLNTSMNESEILSVNNSKVDNNLIKKMPNLKWVLNRSGNLDNISLKHCKENNIGVINIKIANNPVYDWIIHHVKENMCLPWYTVYGKRNKFALEKRGLVGGLDRFYNNNRVHRGDHSENPQDRQMGRESR